MRLPKFVTTNKEGKVLGSGENYPPMIQSQAPYASHLNIWRLRTVGKNSFYVQVDKCCEGDYGFFDCNCIKCQLMEMMGVSQE